MLIVLNMQHILHNTFMIKIAQQNWSWPFCLSVHLVVCHKFAYFMLYIIEKFWVIIHPSIHHLPTSYPSIHLSCKITEVPEIREDLPGSTGHKAKVHPKWDASQLQGIELQYVMNISVYELDKYFQPLEVWMLDSLDPHSPNCQFIC